RISRREPLLCSRHDLTGVEADSDRELGPVLALQLLVEMLERAAQLLGRSYGAQRVVLVHLRHSEDGHHRIADELLDDAAMPPDRVARYVEVARQDTAQAFGIQPLAESGRADDVAEQHSDRLPALRAFVACDERCPACIAEACAC